MSSTTLPFDQIESFIRNEGQATFAFAGRQITLHLQHRHERAYAAKLLMHVAYPQSDIDSMLFQRLVQPGDSVLDAGANIGFTALECLDAGARLVVAVEAVPEIFQRLEQVAGGEIIAVGKALSHAPGTAEITISASHNQGSSLKDEISHMFPAVFGEAPRKVAVELTTIDHLVREFGHFDIWKLDIEGAEVDALLGAKMALSERPPKCIITELYGDFIDQFRNVIFPTHPHAYRAFIRISNYSLVLLPGDTAQSDDYYPTSPMFVFSTEPIAD